MNESIYINFNFSGNIYRTTRKQIEDYYPNYNDIIKNEINKANFNKYLESKITDNTFINNIFKIIFNEVQN